MVISLIAPKPTTIAFNPATQSSLRPALRLRPRIEVQVVEGENHKRWDWIFLEVLVLVVAPDQDDIGLIFIERRSCAREPDNELLSLFGCGACAEVVRRGDQSSAEVVMPNAIDPNTCDERIRAIG